jgi:Flp pilus assembly protein TadG
MLVMSGLLNKLAQSSRRLGRDRKGNIAMMFALAVVPVTMLVGFVIDYGRASGMRAEFDAAADAAVLATVAAGVSEANEQQVAERIMRAHLNATKNIDLKSVLVTSERTAMGRKIKITYRGESKNAFSGLFYKETIDVSNEVSAFQAEPAYSDITFVLDKSSSMLLAASETDRTNMERVTRQMGAEECAFACHRPIYYDSQRRRYYGPSSTQVARDNNIRLRMDVMKDAVSKILTDLKAEQDKLTVHQNVARYTTTIVDFGTNWQLTQAGTNNLSSNEARDAISVTDLEEAADDVEDVDGVEWEWTDFGRVWNATTGVPQLSSLQGSGDGLSPGARRKFLVFVTDGVNDAYNAQNQRVIAAFSSALCDPVKSRGVTVLVLYTRYLPLPGNGFYRTNVQPWYATIEPALRSCASPNMFITADNENEMDAAFARIFTVLNGTRTRLAE